MEDRNNIIRSMISMTGRAQNQQQASSSANVPLDIFSQLDPAVVNQVRQEYLASQTDHDISTTTTTTLEPTLDELLDSLAHEKTITKKLALALDRMKNETPVLQTIAECQSAQNEREKRLHHERNALLERHQAKLETILAKEWIGAKNADEKQSFKEKAAEELDQMDRRILRELDLELRRQQEIFKKIKVPLFYVTKDPSAISLQQQVISLLKTKE
ncbi:hypothetical protein BCR42DRAFT_452321 [Absidia repens]|uniref:Uncharacterized protein n=1 Tax=Absidia repens TaxID=90262 RepID=A0A1X2IDJ5_9FUNG|nr:hypothetical protein BCR42DRAFT_452321 [Absidia repens]